MRLRRWICLQSCECSLHSPLKLWIVTGGDRLRIHIDLDIGRNTVILYRPLARRTEETETGRCHAAAVHQSGITRNADQPAPGALANQRTEFRIAEIPRHRVAARTREFIDEHHFGSENGAAGRAIDGSIARRPIAE